MLLVGALATVVTGSLIGGATHAAADVSPNCQESGYCLFEGAGFTGKKAVVPTSTGCRGTSTLGISAARSAAQGFGDGKALLLYSDTRCTQRITDVSENLASLDPAALSYSLVNLPG
ncbi:hypothetical protein OHT93_18240 [Streptomyces sp. NBC_00191]|uniref:hypothetical protein n=1 Tax=Streptomyces sp. NBC_00191 TaxID=2975674 RepID=UPI00324BBEDB